MPCEPPSDLEYNMPNQIEPPPSPTATIATTSSNNRHDSSPDTELSSDSSTESEPTNDGFDSRDRALSILSKPPSYSTVFPNANSVNNTKMSSLLNKIKQNLNKNTSNNNQTESQNQNIATITGSNLNDPNLQQPISYDELFRNTVTNTQSSIQNRAQSKLVKRFNKTFSQSYYLKHFAVVTLCSFSTISLQIILISNNALYSNWCTGIWTGLLNLLILILSVYTLKFVRIWLIIINILFHIVGIAIIITMIALVNISSFIEYGKCTIQQTTVSAQLQDSNLNFVCSDLLKYGNLVMILINFTIVGMLLGFLIKLIAAVQTR